MLSDRRSNRTLVLLFLCNSYIQCCRNFRAAGVCSNKAIVPADLQSAGIKYKDFSIRLLPIFLINRYESRITGPDIQCCRNFNPLASYCRFIGRSCGSKILIIDAAGSQIRQNISLAVSLQFLYSMLPNYRPNSNNRFAMISRPCVLSAPRHKRLCPLHGP